MEHTGKPSTAQLHRLTEIHRARVHFTLNGKPVSAYEGDTILTAILSNSSHVRYNEFSQQPRAGFCMMGACHDCWVCSVTGERFRACTTFIREGMQLCNDKSGEAL